MPAKKITGSQIDRTTVCKRLRMRFCSVWRCIDFFFSWAQITSISTIRVHRSKAPTVHFKYMAEGQELKGYCEWCKPIARHKTIFQYFGDKKRTLTRFVESCKDIRWNVKVLPITRAPTGELILRTKSGETLDDWCARDWRPDYFTVLYDPRGVTGWKELRMKKADEREVAQQQETDEESVRSLATMDAQSSVNEEEEVVEEEEEEEEEDEEGLEESEGEEREREARERQEEYEEIVTPFMKYRRDLIMRRLTTAKTMCKTYKKLLPVVTTLANLTALRYGIWDPEMYARDLPNIRVDARIEIQKIDEMTSMIVRLLDDAHKLRYGVVTTVPYKIKCVKEFEAKFLDWENKWTAFEKNMSGMQMYAMSEASSCVYDMRAWYVKVNLC